MPRAPASGLSQGPRQKTTGYDYFVHRGRHFGRTVHGVGNATVLIENSMIRVSDAAELGVPLDVAALSSQDRVEHLVYEQMLVAIPRLEQELARGDGGASVKELGKKIQQGVNAARAEDAKGLKPNVLIWIRPFGDVGALLGANKSSRGFQHDVTGKLLCPAEMNWDDLELRQQLRNSKVIVPPNSWPIFVYKDYVYNAQNPWDGLLRSKLLVTAFKHIFTSPSSANNTGKATRMGNAELHGMRHVTRGSVAYVAMQVRFALSSQEVFARSDFVMQSEVFFNTMLTFLWAESETEDVLSLLSWFDGQVFTATVTAITVPTDNSVLATIQAQRAAAAASA